MVYPRFWFGATGRQIMGEDHATKVIALYLVTNPHATMVGIYPCPLRYVAVDTGTTSVEVRTAIAALTRIGFIRYDFESELVWIVNFARYQIPSRSKNVLKGCENLLAALPPSHLVAEFYTEYASTLHLLDLPPNQAEEAGRTADPEIGSENKDQKEQEQEQEGSETLSRPYRDPLPMVSSVQPVAEYSTDVPKVVAAWNDEMTHRAAEKGLSSHKPKQFGPMSKEWEEIRRRLSEGYSVDELSNAVRGMFKTAFNSGENGRAYLSLLVAMASKNVSDFGLKQRESTVEDGVARFQREIDEMDKANGR